MASLDSTIVNISLPTIAEYFAVDIGQISWVAMAYLFVLAGCLLVFGKLGDMKGFRRVFIAGFVLFTAGSLLCGLSATIGQLISFRVVQGIGAAAVDALAPAMIVIYLSAEKRCRALGILATIVSIGIAAGPILGGFITEYTSWHWIFFINIPVGIVAILLATKFLPADRAPSAETRFDIAGGALILLALTTLLYPLNRGLELGWTSPFILGCFAGSVLLWVLFVYHERRCPYPLVDLSLFTRRNFMLGNLASLLLILVFNGVEFLLPFFFEGVQGLSTETAGLLLAVPAVALMVAGPVAGVLSDRFGSRALTTGAALLTGGTLYLFAIFVRTTALSFIILALAIDGIAMGLFFPPNMSQILGSGGDKDHGVASGVMMTVRNIGSVFGVAIFGTIVVQVIIGIMGRENLTHLTLGLLTSGFHVAFLFGVVICIVAAIVSALNLPVNA